MSNLKSKVHVSAGKYSATTTFSGSPTFTSRVPESHGFVSPDMVRLRRNAENPLNIGFPPLRGTVDIAREYAMEQIICGLSGNTGGAIDPLTTSADISDVLDSVFGTDSVNPAGAVDAATGGTPGSKILGVTEQARYPVGIGVRFPVSSGAAYIVRQVRARAGSSGAGNLTLDRTWSGTPDAANVVRMARWKDDPSVFEHKHMGFLVQYQEDNRLYIAGMSRATLDFSRGRYGRLLTNWRFTDVQDDATAFPTSFTAPTRGSALVRTNNSFWIGDDVFYATALRVELGGELVPRNVDDGPHGVLGYVVQKGGGERPRTKIFVRVTRGSNTGEVQDSTGTLSVNKAQAWDKSVGDPTATFDVAFQVGAAAGAVGYGVMPAGCITKCEPVDEDGRLCLDLEIEAMAPSDTNLAPFEFLLG